MLRQSSVRDEDGSSVRTYFRLLIGIKPNSLLSNASASMLTAKKYNAELSYVNRCIVIVVGNNYFLKTYR